MGRLQPESSGTVPSDSDHREETPPVNQPPLAPPPPAVAAEITDVPDSHSPPDTPSPTAAPFSDRHEETLPANEPPLAPPPPAVPAVTNPPDSHLSTDPTRHRDEIQELLETPPPPQPPQRRHDSDDVEDRLDAVAFPPQPPLNQIVPYVEQFPPAGGSSVGNNAQPGGPGRAGNYGQFEVNKPTAAPVRANGSMKEKPARVMLIPFIGVPWTSGLFDCCQHPRNAIITTIAPCATFGQITEILDNGSTSCLAGAMLYFFLFLVICHWNIGQRSRRRMRNAFGLAETPVTDRIAHTMFPLCALCQEFRELKNRGYDPFLGYKGVIAGIVHDPNPVMVNPPPDQLMTHPQII